MAKFGFESRAIPQTQHLSNVFCGSMKLTVDMQGKTVDGVPWEGPALSPSTLGLLWEPSCGDPPCGSPYRGQRLALSFCLIGALMLTMCAEHAPPWASGWTVLSHTAP